MFSILTTFWKPIAFGILILSILGGLRYYGYTEYKRGYAEMNVKYVACQESFKTEHSRWQAMVDKQQNDLDVLSKKKQEVITETVTIYKDVIKRVEVQKKETTNAIQANIRPTDIVTVPNGFVGVYNSAVEGSRIASGEPNKGSKEVPPNSSGIVGKTTLFDATYFTEVMKGNIDIYNEVAARCTMLIDLVKNIEKAQE